MDLPNRWTPGTVDVDGTTLQCYRTGDGPPLVFAHGMFDNGRRWIPLGNDLADDYEVVTFDARGHGRSDAPADGYDIDTRIADLVGLLDGLGLDAPVVIGHSMGGATAAWAAATYPERFRGLVLVDPARFHPAPEIDPDEAAEQARDRLQSMQSQPIDERIADHYADLDCDEDHRRRLAAAVDECSPHIANLAQEHPPVRDALGDIACPTLLLRRDAGTEARVRDRDAAQRLTDGRLVHVPDAGHYVFRDAPEAASAELRTFLARL